MKYNPSDLNTNFKKYLKDQNLSEATTKYYISDVRVFLRFVYQITGDYDMTSETFESYENYLKSGGLPPKTINRKLSSLRIFNTFLLKTGVLQNDLMKKIRNTSKSHTSTRSFIPQVLVLFIAIILIGGFFLTQSQNQTKNINPKASTNSISIPTSIKTDATNIPETLDGRQLNQITIESDETTSLDRKSAGSAFIPSGALEKIIYNPFAFKDGSIIFITPTSSHDTYYFVTQDDGFFKVTLTKTQKTNFNFNWFVVSVQLPIDRLP